MVQRETQSAQENRKWQDILERARDCWKAGDDVGAEEPWVELQEKATPLLLWIARSKLPPKWNYEAEEIVSMALIEVWRMVATGQEVRNVRPLLKRIVSNRVIDFLRHEPNVHSQSADAYPDFWETNSDADRQASVIDNVERAVSVRQEINYVLDALTPLERDILVCRYLRDLDIKETTKAMNVTIDTVKQGQKRALAHAREKMQERGIDYGNL